jgi:divalent metal cation (Fe/Co/Zn/Cd) transporter
MSSAGNDHIDRLYKKGLYLEYLTVGYNFFEALASVGFGSLASSIALIGFGLDSIIESLSGLVLVWRLRQRGKISKEEEERVERRAIRLVAVSFFVLGLYVLEESVRRLVIGEVPETSLPGIFIAIASLIFMPLLAWQKIKTGRAIGSRALVADSRESIACGFLSLALLIGLGANYLFGFWQADPIAGLVIVFFLFREGWEGWKDASEEQDNGT